MSRVTPPVTKFTHAIRGISSSAKTARPSGLLDSQAGHNAYLPRNLKDLRAECSKRQLKTAGNKGELAERLAAYDITRSHSTFGGHRPVRSSQTPAYKTIPLMQGFRTSAPKQAVHDSSTIDFAFLPNVPEEGPANPFSKLRVPLLPDNYTPDRSANSAHAVETLDPALPGPQISVVAADPEKVTVAAMTEVVDNAGIDIDLKDLTAGFSATPVEEIKHPGALKELWNDFVDDIFGAKNVPRAA